MTSLFAGEIPVLSPVLHALAEEPVWPLTILAVITLLYLLELRRNPQRWALIVLTWLLLAAVLATIKYWLPQLLNSMGI